jgi:hypothetical protein
MHFTPLTLSNPPTQQHINTAMENLAQSILTFSLSLQALPPNTNFNPPPTVDLTDTARQEHTNQPNSKTKINQTMTLNNYLTQQTPCLLKRKCRTTSTTSSNPKLIQQTITIHINRPPDTQSDEQPTQELQNEEKKEHSDPQNSTTPNRPTRKRKQNITLSIPEPRHTRVYHEEATRHLLHTAAARPHTPPTDLKVTDRDPPHLVVSTSAIPNAGRGLYTLNPIKRGSKICTYYGHKIPTTTVRSKDYKSPVAFEVIGTAHSIDPKISDTNPDWQCIGAYINDPLDASKDNCKFHINPNTHKVTIIATQDIQPYQELYLPYGHFYWSSITDTEQPLYAMKEERYEQDQLDEDHETSMAPTDSEGNTRKRRKRRKTHHPQNLQTLKNQPPPPPSNSHSDTHTHFPTGIG